MTAPVQVSPLQFSRIEWTPQQSRSAVHKSLCVDVSNMQIQRGDDFKNWLYRTNKIPAVAFLKKRPSDFPTSFSAEVWEFSWVEVEV